MKKLVYFFLFFLAAGLVEFTAAQTDSNTVNLQLWINCRNTASAQLFSAQIKEGQTYIVQPSTLPAAYANAQGLYDAFVGTEFKLEYGALNENVDILWFLWDVNCSTGNFFQPTNGTFFFNGFFQVMVNGTPVTTNYTFANNKRAILAIPKSTAFINFLTSLGLSSANLLTFAYQATNGGIDTTGITTFETSQYLMALATHFSNIVGGDQTIVTGVEDNSTAQPVEYNLSQNYPNPFNPSTSFDYSVPEKSFVTVKVYNLLGSEIAELVNEVKEAGVYRLDFNASNLPSGMYIYELRTGSFVQARKMMLMK